MTPTLNVIGIVVSDMGRALAFYRRLGLVFPDGADSEPHVETAVSDGLKIAFDTEDTIRSFEPDWAGGTGSGRVNLAFACDSPADVDKVFGELSQAGYDVVVEPWDAFWGQRYAIVSDPDGNHVDLYAALPST